MSPKAKMQPMLYIGGGSPQCVLFARETHVRFIGTYVHAYICMSIYTNVMIKTLYVYHAYHMRVHALFTPLN